jgi:hypothetical protein
MVESWITGDVSTWWDEQAGLSGEFGRIRTERVNNAGIALSPGSPPGETIQRTS